jgi:broad specificity phosphatase PhoE
MLNHVRRCAIALTAALCLSGVAVIPVSAQEAVYIVRHAERLDASQDSPLSADGQARAARLAEMLRDSGITAVIATQYTRTFETARPLAEARGLTISRMKADDIGGLLQALKKAGPRGRVLVVGHSDTVPAILEALGFPAPVTIAVNEYDNLFIVSPAEGKIPVVVRLRY